MITGIHFTDGQIFKMGQLLSSTTGSGQDIP
jgi:hypothetical protein